MTIYDIWFSPFGPNRDLHTRQHDETPQSCTWTASPGCRVRKTWL